MLLVVMIGPPAPLLKFAGLLDGKSPLRKSEHNRVSLSTQLEKDKLKLPSLEFRSVGSP